MNSTDVRMTREQFNEWARAQGCNDWENMQDFPSLHKPISDWVSNNGTGSDCYNYLRDVGHSESLLNRLIEVGTGWDCYNYLRYVGHNGAVLNRLVEVGTPLDCYRYLCYVGHNDAVANRLTN